MSLAAHREYVDQHAAVLLLSGPLLDDDGRTRIGQLFVINVRDRDAALRFVADDPFTQAGIFADIDVWEFKPVFQDGRRV